MTDEEAMEALLNSGGYSFPTWTLKLGLPTDEMCLVMSLIASDEAPIPVDVAYISEYLHMDGAVVESSVKELLDRRLVYKKDSYLILDLEMCDHIFDATATVRQAKVNSDIDEAFCPPIPLVAMRAGEIYSDSSLVGRLVLGFISAWSFAADFCPYCPHDIAKLLPTYVTAGYSINGYIEDLGERIAKEESAGRRAELLADFNELRDCASRAANLPAIFQKYFEGIEKVIVFCPNVFELNEIEKMCPRWFSRVNGNVHTYVVHSSNPFGTSEYDGFKEDDDETSIKLLLCVNQLNEGVHIKGVDAVIMVRRTSSPTIFYQQLGRALTAAGNFEPLVIDLVDNFEMRKGCALVRLSS